MQQQKQKQVPQIGDLVEYSDQLPFAMHSSVGVVVEILDMKEEWEKLEEDEDPQYAKGFLEELKMFHALNSINKTPDIYPQERQDMFDKMLRYGTGDCDSDSVEFEFLVRVVWTSGESYIEHPDDLNIVLRVQEAPNEQEG